MKKFGKAMASAVVCTLLGSITALAGEWKSDANGWWYTKDDGSYVVSDWLTNNGKMYYFNADGYMASNAWIGNYYVGNDGAMLTNTTTPDGYYVGADGVWVEGGQPEVQDNQYADYYRFIHDTLLPELGYVNTDKMTKRLSSDDYFEQVEAYRYWDNRNGLFTADIADLNGDGTDDLIVYYFDWQKSPGVLLAQIYSRENSGKVYWIATEELGRTSACERYYSAAGVVTLADGMYLYMEEHVHGVFADYSSSNFSLYQLTKDGEWIRKYKIGKSGGGTSEVSYSIWSYAGNDTYEETILWSDESYRLFNENAQILTPRGTKWADAIALGLGIIGMPNRNVSGDNGISDVLSEKNNFFARQTLSYDVKMKGYRVSDIESTLTDYSQFRENMNPYDAAE